MKGIRKTMRVKAQKKYRKNQSSKGLVRYEIQVEEKSKQKFEAVVKAAADEYTDPWDERQRMALARTQMFNKITEGTVHEFSELKRQIKALQDEVQALAPKFFAQKKTSSPLPSAISSLPDDPEHLKILLAKIFSEGQQAKRQATEYKRRADQYEELYKVATNHSEELERRLQGAS